VNGTQWIIEMIGANRYMSMFGWSPSKDQALRFDTSDDAERHIRQQRIPNAQAVHIAAIEHAPVAGVEAEYNPFGVRT
jgi:hypothetical protein